MAEVSHSQKRKDQISLKELLLHIRSAIRFLLKKWKIILVCCLAGLLAGLAYAYFSVPKYLATTSFVTDTDQDNLARMNSYAGLAAAFGLNVGNGELQNSLFSGDNIYDLMKTRRMLENTLLTPVTIDGKKMLLIDRYIQMKRLRKKWEKNPHLKNISFDKDTSQYTLYHNKVIASICKSIVAHNLQFPNGRDGSGNSSLMSVTVVSPDEQFSALFVTNLINNVARYYINTTTKTARNTLNVLNKQLDSVRHELYGAMSNVASFSDQNLNLIRQRPQVQQEKGTLKMKVNSAIYQQLVSAVETAKMSLQKETPLFEIVDKPILPLDKKQPDKIFWMIAGAFLGLLLASGGLLCYRFYQYIMSD